jgi:branched-subunit amino acid aminotransferase/4-amino-4-deoxychorismate lyase
MIFDFAVVNGQLIPEPNAQISIFNKAVFSSFGVYEAIKIDRGRPFYLDDHLGRLRQSAALLDLTLNVDPSTLHNWAMQLIQLEPHATCRLFIIAFGPAAPNTPPIVAIRAEPLPTYPDTCYQTGASAVLFEGERALPACKSLNTLVNYLARRAATHAGALEGLLHNHGYLTEGARSNMFAVRNGQLLTPPATQVLSGITRDVIVQVMADTPHPVSEAPLSVELAQYDEFFISSTSMHVMPITQIDGQPVGDGHIGPVTKLAMTRFEEYYRRAMRDVDELSL